MAEQLGIVHPRRRALVRYTSKGWFGVLEWLSGTKNLRTGVVYPDRYGCLKRRLVVGPYETADEAARALA